MCVCVRLRAGRTEKKSISHCIHQRRATLNLFIYLALVSLIYNVRLAISANRNYVWWNGQWCACARARARARFFIMRVQGQSNIFLNTILIDSRYSGGGA